jgi:two-component system, OmpR family, response regulator
VSDPFRVLIVDDDADVLSMVARVLRGQNIEVTVSATSLGVSNLIRRSTPDVVLIDVHIPELSGDALVAVARRQAPSHTRFVLYSSCDEEQLRERAKRVGADGFISKSVDPYRLPDLLRNVARRP